jgi:hypothetical protein
MTELENDFGTVSGQQDLTHYVTSFYAWLYTSDAGTPGTDLCWQSIPSMVTGDTNCRNPSLGSRPRQGGCKVRA